MEILIITQARMGSSRLPGKVLKKIQGQSLLEIHLKRIQKSKLFDHLILATTNLETDDPLEAIGHQLGVEVFRGSEDNVLDRFYKAAVTHQPKWVVRLTADCPLIDPVLIDDVIAFVHNFPHFNYVSNTLTQSFPDGQDIEIFPFGQLEQAWRLAMLPSEKEHVTPFIRKQCDIQEKAPRLCADFPSPDKCYGEIRMTVDESADFEVIQSLVEEYGVERDWLFYANKIIDQRLHRINGTIERNVGAKKSYEKDREQERNI
jgi:spore coat polysaccharide biosynthesis protein SpsF